MTLVLKAVTHYDWDPVDVILLYLHDFTYNNTALFTTNTVIIQTLLYIFVLYLRLLPLWGIRVGMVIRKCLFPVAHFSFRERFCKVRWHPRVAVIYIGSLLAIISKRSTATSAVERLGYRKASHDVAYTTGWLGGNRLLDCWKRSF